MLRTSFLLQTMKKGSNSVNIGDRVIVHAFCNSLHGLLSVYQVSFILNTFRDMLYTSLLLQKFKREITLVITCDRVMVPALCTSSDESVNLSSFI